MPRALTLSAPDLTTATSVDRLVAGESFTTGLPRVCLTELQLAIDTLRHEPQGVKAVHETRKLLKRVRAQLRMVRDHLGYYRYREENVVLRDVARRLSPVRSAAVMVATADAVLGDEPTLLDAPRARGLLGELERRHRRLSDQLAADEQLVVDAVTTLGCAARRYAAWPTETGNGGGHRRPFPNRFETVAPGLRRTYRQGRRLMRRAAEERTTEAFHLWRKRAKYLRHQIEMLEKSAPDELGRLAASFDELATILGDEHDLAELSEIADGDGELVADTGRRHRLNTSLGRRRRTLQEKALALGESLYERPPKEFVADIEALATREPAVS